MPEILSFDSNQKVAGPPFYKQWWESLTTFIKSRDRFTKITAITIVLLTIISLSATKMLFDIRQRAAGDIPPIGSMDVGDDSLIAGWAKDPDTDTPIMVHIYIDGILVEDVKANVPRSDVGAHGFSFYHPSLGSGTHEIRAYAIDVDSHGALTNNNIELGNSPKSFTGDCNGFREGEDEQSWCLVSRDDNIQYWQNRQKDTKLLWNDNVKIGFNNSYGGMITQFYSNDRAHNLITEHPGAAVQLSVWGYENNGGGWIWSGPDGAASNTHACDPTTYPAPDLGNASHPISDTAKLACEAKNASCSQFPSAGGAQIANCTTVKTCNTFAPAAPWNPLQAGGEDCKWETPTNDVTPAEVSPGVWEIKQVNPYQFTKTNAFDGLEWTQRVSLGDAYAKLDYTIKYNGNYTTLPYQPQELPAIFAAGGMNQKFYFYEGYSPFTNPNSPVRELVITQEQLDRKGWDSPNIHYLGLPNRNPQLFLHNTPPRSPYGIADEYWWGVCNEDESQCLTIATFSPLVYETGFGPSAPENRGAYLTPLGIFQLKPGFNEHLNVYMFPYKWDKVINGKSVRERIFELARTELPTPTPTPTLTPTPTNTPSPTQTPPPLPPGQASLYFTNEGEDAPLTSLALAPGETKRVSVVLDSFSTNINGFELSVVKSTNTVQFLQSVTEGPGATAFNVTVFNGFPNINTWHFGKITTTIPSVITGKRILATIPITANEVGTGTLQFNQVLITSAQWDQAVIVTASQLTYTVIYLAEDVDKNGCISLEDFNQWKTAYLGNTIPSTSKPDINNDGTVTLLDFNLWFKKMKTGQNICL